jgi:DNA polymerase III alpha subunit
MIQLRVRTEYTFGETFSPIDRCVARLKAIGATAAGIVDPGTWGHVGWDKACRAADIQPLFGVQLSVVPSLETEDRPSMWFLALDSAGLKELYTWSSLAQRQSHRGAARLTYEQVMSITDHIAKFAGQVLDGPTLRSAKAIIDIDPSLPQLNKRKARLAQELGLRIVATSDNAYASIGDKLAFEMIGSGTKVTPQHILSEGEFKVLCAEAGAYYPKCAEVAAEIAEQAKDVKLPKAPIIQLDGDLEALCRAGIEFRKMAWTGIYETRLKRELELIRSKKFESYFLMVADMVRFAKEHMLVGPSRGSAAGSLVCYLARITEVDPIPAQLIFERFIDVTRNDLPDIDLDFPDNKREMVIDYLRKQYGAANVAHIGTISRFKPKSALAAVGKRLGIPPWEFDGVKDSIFERSSGDSRANFSLLDTLEQTDPGRKLLEKFPAVRLAAEIEAHASHAGVHAAGILVCNDAIENYCTVTADGTAQVDKKDAEKLNLLKIDVLGLRTLGVLEDSGVQVDWYHLPLNDPKVLKVLNDRRFAGIFQFEGLSLQSITGDGQISVESLEDIGHITAIARPGPMASGGATLYINRRNGKVEYRTPHPVMDKYVKDTFGVVIYQEQVIQICREVGKLNWEDTTSIRKAMSGRLGVEFFNKFQSVFTKGAAEEGVDEAAAKEIWSQINTMGSWAFNLAHSYSYAVVSYWTAWLKAYHLLEFAAATLRNAKDDDSAIKLLRELTREGIGYVPFDAERSEINWAVKDGKLYGGFIGLKGIGESKARALIEQRNKEGGKLPPNVVADLSALPNAFDDPFPTMSRFKDWYENPQAHGIREGTKLAQVQDIRGEAEFVYIGRLVGKDLRDHNEEIRVKRRNGKRWKGPTLFLDLDIEDDTGKVLTRIERYDFEEVGRPIWENAQPGTWWMVRAERKLWGRPDGGFKMVYVKKIMPLKDPKAKA